MAYQAQGVGPVGYAVAAKRFVPARLVSTRKALGELHIVRPFNDLDGQKKSHGDHVASGAPGGPITPVSLKHFHLGAWAAEQFKVMAVSRF